jgi:hypothetical protein
MSGQYSGEMLKNSDEGARHLASNLHIHHYDEGPAEKLDSILADYLAVKASENEEQQAAWLVKQTKVSSKHGQIFNHDETCKYLIMLREFRPHFNVDQYFSVKFCTNQYHKYSGAVST